MTVVERLAASVSPASGAVLMGTGIVSVGLSIDGFEALSLVLLGIAALVWLVLAGVLLTLALRLRGVLREWGRTPAALTGVAGTNVLATRLAMLGLRHEAAALLALATALWLLLVPTVLAHWRRPTVGVSFVLAVGTESIGLVAARLGGDLGVAWLVVAAVGFAALGVVSYLFVVASFDLRQLLVGRGDQWVSGGALAIATLAYAGCAQAAAGVDGLHGAAGALRTVALVLWVAAAAWLPPLLAAELGARRGGYDVGRWSTVFPLGMYAVCSFVDAKVEGIDALATFARVWIWVAFAVWALVLARMLHRTLEVARAAVR